MSLDEFIREYSNGKLSNSPGYFANRGNTLADLSPELLEQLHAGVVQQYGDDAAAHFTRMVAALTKQGDISATTFILALRELKGANWKFSTQIDCRDPLAQAISEAYEAGHAATGHAVMMNIMGGAPNRGLPATEISGAFLESHQSEMKESWVERYEGETPPKRILE